VETRRREVFEKNADKNIYTTNTVKEGRREKKCGAIKWASICQPFVCCALLIGAQRILLFLTPRFRDERES